MPRSAARDTRHLEQKNGLWRVVIAVPRGLQPILGTTLKRPLGTDSLTEANRKKWTVVAEFRALIAAGGRAPVPHGDPLLDEASALAAGMDAAKSAEEEEMIADAGSRRFEELLGDPVEGAGGRGQPGVRL